MPQKAQKAQKHVDAFVPFVLLWLKSRPESLAILGREEEAKDHVPEVVWIGVQCVEPVLESNRVRVAPQIAKVLHRYERSVEELIGHGRALDDLPQYLAARHLPGV